MPEQKRRVDRIVTVSKEHGGRARAREVVLALRDLEENETLTNSSVWVAIQGENDRREKLGKKRLFGTYRDGGEDWGWIRLEEASPTAAEGMEEAAEIEQKIARENEAVDEKISRRLGDMDWRTFESTYCVAEIAR